MHYEVNYKKFETVSDRDAAAIGDIREFMGDERFARVDQLYRQMEPLLLDVFRLQLSFAGIGGYPVEAWHRSLWPTAGVVIDAVADVDYSVH